MVLTKLEIKDWFASSPKGDDHVQCDEVGLYFAFPESNCIDLEYPMKLERLPGFARCLSAIGYDIVDFRGAMLWFTEWGVWDPIDEGPWYRIIESMRAAAGQPRSFEAATAHHYRADELEQAVGGLLQPMVFGWDAYCYPSWSYGTDEFFLHVNHDSFVTVVTRTKAFYDKVYGLLKEFNFDPMPGHDLQLRRFCRIP